MTHKSDAERYQTLSSTQELLRGVEDASDAFLLEDILAEYGDGSVKEEKKPAEKAEPFSLQTTALSAAAEIFRMRFLWPLTWSTVRRFSCSPWQRVSLST